MKVRDESFLMGMMAGRGWNRNIGMVIAITTGKIVSLHQRLEVT